MTVLKPLTPETGIALSGTGWEALVAPRSIALIGASGRASSVSFTSRLVATNEALGYGGTLYMINPKRDEVFGLKAWDDVGDLPEAPDVTAINLPGEMVLDAARAAIAAGTKALMIHSGGFGERGADGAAREAELKALCAEAGVAALGPNCLGIMSLTRKASVSSFKTGKLGPGPLALISQSGSVATILMQIAQPFGASLVASTGNEAVTTAEDLMHHAIEDPDTRIIVGFVEALRRPELLFGLARRARAAGKPIILLKAGLTGKGGEVSRGHTGALAGSGEVYRQALAQAGIVMAEDFEELAQMVELFATLKAYPAGGRLGMLSTSGGELGNVTDLCEAAGVDLPPLADATLRTLQDRLALPEDVLPRNPVDVGTGFAFAGTYEERMRGAIDAVASDPDVDIVTFVQGVHRDSEDMSLSLNHEICKAAAKEAERQEKPMVFLPTQVTPPDETIAALLRDAGIPILRGVRPGLAALRALRAYMAAGEVPAPMQPLPFGGDTLAPWSDGTVPQARLFAALDAAGLPVTRFLRATDATLAEAAVADLGRAVMKTDTPRAVHKSDIGGVALNVTQDAAADTYQRLCARLTPPVGSEAGEGIFIAEQLDGGTEFYVGAKRDATFGTVVVCGMGGRMLEVMERTALLVCPFTEADALAALDRSGAGRFLDGFRGGPVADRAALARLIVTVGRIASGLGAELETLDLNPVIVTHDRPGGCIADARLILTKGTDQ